MISFTLGFITFLKLFGLAISGPVLFLLGLLSIAP